MADILPLAEPDSDADTSVFLIWAICANPAAVTAAACIAPTMIPAGGGMVSAAWVNAPIAPEIVSMVAAEILNVLIFLAFFSAFSESFSYISAMLDRMPEVADATDCIISICCFAFSFASWLSSSLNLFFSLRALF